MIYERYCPSGQELCTYCLQELVYRNGFVPLNDELFRSFCCIPTDVVDKNYVADNYCISYDYHRTSFPYRIFRLARTIHQLKFIRMFPSLYYRPYTPGCTQRTRQVLSLLRFVYSYCMDPLCQVMNLPFVHWNISRIV